MSKLTRALILAAMLAAMNLAGLTAVAQAQANDETPPASRRGENLRTRARPGGRPPAAGSESLTPPQRIAGADPADAALQPAAGPERLSVPNGTPAQVPAPVPPPNRTDSPAGSSLRSVDLRRPWRSSLGWPCWPPERASRRARLGHAT